MRNITIKSLTALALFVFLFSPVLSPAVQVGEKVIERFETDHPYPGGKDAAWEKTFHYAGAGYIAVHFSQFDLAKGDYVEIFSPDGKFRYIFEEKGKKVKLFKKGTRELEEQMLSSFWASHIPGDTAIVRLVAKNKKGGWGFVIDMWAHGYARGFISEVMTELENDDLANVRALCSTDDKEWIKCYDGTAMYDESKALCRLLINGTTACTGWLLGSEGHVMTNQHCIEIQADASNTDFEFMAEGATCATDCSSWGACPGTIAASSGTLVRTDYDLDYSLILLPTNVSSTYGYMQLRNELPAVGERIYLPQHPGNYGKQIAVDSDTDGPFAKIYSTSQPACHGGPGDIGYYADTEGGSSGSPVLAYADNLVVALHHCGTCPNRGVPVTAIITHLAADLPDNAVGGGGGPVSYCSAYSKNQNYEWIARVQLGNLDNSTSASAYSGFVNRTAALAAGANVNVTLTPGFVSRSYIENWKVWIDYNADGDFADAGEEVFSSSGTGPVSGNFTVPTSAGGSKRMRIAMYFGSSPSSCNSFSYGEIEDYGVSIQ